jgi:hypothetical protein
MCFFLFRVLVSITLIKAGHTLKIIYGAEVCIETYDASNIVPDTPLWAWNQGDYLFHPSYWANVCFIGLVWRPNFKIQIQIQNFKIKILKLKF